MLDVLYRSSDLLAINKPSGISLLSDRSGAPCLWDTLRDELAAQGCEPFSIHRIDKGTSGVLLVALTRERQAQLTKSFADRDVRKFYVARVLGDVDLDGSTGHHRPAVDERTQEPLPRCGTARAHRPAGITLASERTHHEGHDSVSRLRRMGGGRPPHAARAATADRPHASAAGPSRVDRPSDSRRSPVRQTRLDRATVAASGVALPPHRRRWRGDHRAAAGRSSG